VAFRFRGRLKQAHAPSSRDFVGDGGGFTDSAKGCEAVHSLGSRFGAPRPNEPTGRKSPVTVLESTRPGEDSTGAGAEREWGFDPQSKAELAQSEYKGASEVLARHAHTAQPWGAGPGGC
jgi:hypothetical protein